MTDDFTDCPLPTRPDLLVSVRNYAEFESARAAGVDILDFKEPRHGPLAPADAQLWVEVARAHSRRLHDLPAGPHAKLSAALGERQEAESVVTLLPGGFEFAKAGPSGCRDETDLCEMWRTIEARLNPTTELVAVAYADHLAAHCLEPEQILQAAIRMGFRRYLIDTWTKDGRSTLEWMELSRLRELSCEACKHGVWWALAGSITCDFVPTLWEHRVFPDCFAVRGDVCEGGRTGRLCSDRLARWKTVLAAQRATL